jgi:3-oxoacyl-[acyl-carrier protein] reductase
MEKALQDKVIVITGASGGIGKAIAKNLANNGASLLLLGGKNAQNLLDFENELKNDGVNCVAVPGNLTHDKTIDNGLKICLEKFNKVDVLINNAGTATNCPFSQVSKTQFDEIMELNAKAPFFITQKFLPYIKQSKSATIVNIASIVGHNGYPNQSIYSASKHALIGWSKALANELYKENVRVHVISPGGVYTDMIKITRPDLMGEGMIMPEDIAKIVEFMLVNRTNAVIDEIIVHRDGKEPFLA